MIYLFINTNSYMLVWIIVNLIGSCIGAWLFQRLLGFLGVFFLLFGCISFNLILIIYDLYTAWLTVSVYEINLFTWVELGNNLIVPFAIRGDFSSLFIVFIMNSGALFVFWFVLIDLWDDKENSSFIINLGYFLIFMIIMTVGSNLFVFYLGWEGIGIMSLVLVSFWSERLRSLKATFKIFFITKIGDIFVLATCSWLLLCFNEADFYVLNTCITIFPFKSDNLFWLPILLILSGSVKSAQLGFHIWLLEAMEAPLGASALMHSSTLVIAGLVFIFKLYPILYLNSWSFVVMYWLGLFTALTAAAVACFQFELKVIMAYSTISNMGYLMILLSYQAFQDFLFLLIIHAYIKIFLFLSFGAIILHANGCQDIRWISNLNKVNLTLYASLVFGLSNLAGVPFFSGYSCKQNILTASSLIFASNWNGEILLLFSYGLTLIYNIRVFTILNFTAKTAHVSFFKPKNMYLSLILNFIILIILIYISSSIWTTFLASPDLFMYLQINSFSSQHLLSNIFPPISTYQLWLFVYFIVGCIFSLVALRNTPSSVFFVEWELIWQGITNVLCMYIVICSFDRFFLNSRQFVLFTGEKCSWRNGVSLRIIKNLA